MIQAPVTVLRRSIRRTRRYRLALVLAAALNGAALAANLAQGSALALLPAVLIIACLVLIVMQTRLIGRARELTRPRMTPEDYRRLREMEIALGWEPSEPPAPGTALKPDRIMMTGLPAPGWSTLPPAPRRSAADSGVKDAAALHFAQLARVGRESCASPCRLCECEARGRHYPAPESRAALAAKVPERRGSDER